MNDPASRPALEGKIADLGDYDRIFVGFPIWWGVAPRVINSFLEQQSLAGKVIIPFATSGGSNMGGTNQFIKERIENGVNRVIRSVVECLSTIIGREAYFTL